MKKRILSMILVVVMVFTSVDITAFAQEINRVELGAIIEDEDVQEEGTTAPTEEVEEASEEPTEELTNTPEEGEEASTEEVSEAPSVEPTDEPTKEPVVGGIEEPSAEPSFRSEEEPSMASGIVPTIEPIVVPEDIEATSQIQSEVMSTVTPDIVYGMMPEELSENESAGCNEFIAPIDDPDASAVRISTAEELYNIRNDMYGSYVLMNDIDLSGYEDWEPIGGSLAKAFCGKIDGQGHKITGLTIKENFTSGTVRAPSYSVGLFGVCNGAQIKNIAIENADISVVTTSGNRYTSAINSNYSIYAGSIAGYVTNSTVMYNCCISGNVSAKAYEEGYSDAYAGGLIGWGDTAIISYCNNVASVQGYNGNTTQSYDAYAGGLAGAFGEEGVIDRSYNSGKISAITLDFGNAYAGGIIATSVNASVNITDAYNEGQIQGQAGNMFSDNMAYAGGIAAEFSGTIDNVYNSGSVIAYVNDPYGISNGIAYAGGICGISSLTSVISDAAIVQSTVAATASGARYQYRISYLGNKSNTITIDTVTSGSINDATIVKSEDEMKTSEPYTELMGWDFSKIWNMIAGEEFPQLKLVDTESDEYQDEYITQHLEYIKSSEYANLLDNYRWAQIYWSQENNFASNLGEKLYDGVDATVDLLTLNFADLFDDGNPYKVILADYIADQTVEEELLHLYKTEIPYSLDKTYKKVEKFIRDNWKDEYGELSDEDLFWLFHYKDKTSEHWINSDFEKHIETIVYDDKSVGFDTALGLTTETLDTILEQKGHLDKTIDWFNGLIDYSGHVAAYVSADAEFKTILEKMCENLPESTNTDKKYKFQLSEAIKSYTQYNDKESITVQLFANYIGNSAVENFEKVVQDQITKQVTNWIKAVFSEKALAAINKIGWAADATWKITEYVTKNGELQECREMLRANAYFEDTMYNTLRGIENDFKVNQTIENARLFDAAYKFFKETELYSMDVCMTYMDTYQTAWLSAIRNQSNTFMNSAIEEVHINKLFLYNSYCHGVSYNLGGKVITIACPTNVFVYDENGMVVASVEDNIVTECSDMLVACSIDNVKIITVPLDQNYSIKIDATDSGSMSYSVAEYDADYKNIQTTVYADVNINKGDSYSGEINNQLETESSSYNLMGSNSEMISDYKCVTETDNIPITSLEIQSEKEILNIGESISLKKIIIPNEATNQSVVWTSSDSNVAVVSEEGVVTGMAEGTAIITVRSLYGGKQDTIVVTVVSDERVLYFTKQPIGDEYKKGEKAIPLSISYYVKEDTEVSCQWYMSENPNMNEKVALEGADDIEYVPSTQEVGVFYYCIELMTDNEIIVSDIVRIEVLESKIIASGTSGENIQWKLNDKYELDIYGTGKMESYPTKDEIPWNEYVDAITSVRVADGITSISAYAFVDMRELKVAELGTTINEVAEGAFANCISLEEIKLPFVGVSRMATGENAVLGAIFGKVSSGGVVQYYELDGNSLNGYRYGIPESLKKVTITDAEKIPFGAFYNCEKISEIVLNEGILNVEAYSLCNCSGLTSISIPDSVETIEEYALKNCVNLEQIVIPFVGSKEDSENTFDAVFGHIFGRSSEGTVQYYKLEGTSLSGYYYNIPTKLAKVTVTRDKKLPFGSFSNCENIVDLYLDVTIQEIEDYALYNDIGLCNVYFKGNAPTIQNEAFINCGDIVAYIPGNNSTWIDEVKKNYGANSIEWRLQGDEEDDEEELIVEAPYANIPSGSQVDAGTEIVLSCSVEDARIYYTLNETIPTEASTLYTEPIVIQENIAITAVAVKEGYKNSPIVTFTYRIADPKPIVYIVNFQSNGGTEVENQEVEENGTVTKPENPIREGYRFVGWYLEDKLYDFNLPVTGNLRLEAKWEEIDTLSAPLSNVVSGSAVPEGSKIILSTSEAGTKIYYTLDGTIPTRTSFLYEQPIVIEGDVVINAIAVKAGYKDSPVATFTYMVSITKEELGDILPEDVPEEGIEAVPEGLWIAGVDEEYTYTGKVIKPAIRVYDHKTLLRAKTDYTISYKNNKRVNNASKVKTAPTITVTGKGNYKGTETVTFKILKKDIAETDITAADIKVAYNKKVQKKVPTVKRGSTSLKKDTDFTVSYPDLDTNSKAYKEPGEYTILVKGKGGYTGQREVKLTITESKLMSKVTVSTIATQPYTGAAVTTATMNKAPIVKYGEKTKLKEGIHYTVSYENNINIGTATMILTGTDTETPEGTFTGTKKVTFKIGGTSLAKAAVTGVPTSMTYTGVEINEQTENWGNPIKVVLNGDELTRAVDAESEGDYIVTFSKNTNKGTATVTIKGINAYSGSIKKEFTINAYNINDNVKQNLVTEEMDTNTVYAKGGSKPEPVVKFGETTLVKGKDYTLTYANNTKWHDGTSTSKRPTVTITGKGNFKGTVKIPYTIAKQDISNLKITASDVVYKKEKGAYKATPVVKDLDNKTLKVKTDYTVASYTYGQDVTLKNGTERKAGDTVGKNDIVPAGTLLKVAITGKGNYTNTTPLVAEYRVVKSSIAKATVTAPSQSYTGKSITIEDKTKIKVKVGKTKLDPEDFEIVDGSFKNNTKAGTASFTIRGVGNYGGTKKVTFKIKPKGFIWWWRK